ncbi:MAG: DUF6089 family protein [Bacteroidia bacterium]|nr:DUF6089 family protein [Bacteroidia bacterium]
MRYIAILLIAGMMLAPSVNAQVNSSYLRVGVSGGSTNYLGDLDDDLTFRFTKAALGVDLSYKFNPLMSARVSFAHGWASASDSVSSNFARNRRNLHFRTPITEGSFQLVIDFIANDRRFRDRPDYVPYVFGGLSIFKFNPQAFYQGEWVDLQRIGTEGQFILGSNNPGPYALVQMAIPMGAGVRIRLSDQWDFELETGFRKTFTDYLDDVSGEYPDRDELFESAGGGALGTRAVLLSDPDNVADLNGIRGDRTQSDWYVFTVARINYIFDWRRCPQPRRRFR